MACCRLVILVRMAYADELTQRSTRRHSLCPAVLGPEHWSDGPHQLLPSEFSSRRGCEATRTAPTSVKSEWGDHLLVKTIGCAPEKVVCVLCVGVGGGADLPLRVQGGEMRSGSALTN
jgi:hypothetical protein